MNPFARWEDLLVYLRGNNAVYYKAPLDFHPVRVEIAKIYKNGKLRVKARDVSFTADPGHLDRFTWKP